MTEKPKDKPVTWKTCPPAPKPEPASPPVNPLRNPWTGQIRPVLYDQDY